MIYQRGTKENYEDWGKLGFKSWNYENFLHYFNKFEGLVMYNTSNENSNYGKNGEFKISEIRSPHSFSSNLIKALKDELKLEELSKNENHKDSVGSPHVSLFNGEKMNIASSYLNPNVLKRSNLWIRTHSTVQKILFDEDKKAFAVEVGNNRTIIRCKREIILTAGAIGSPKLLMMSGIGDKDSLEKLNINVVYNNSEVGKNLNDHPTISILKTTQQKDTLDYFTVFPQYLINLIKWILFRNNELSSNTAEVTGFITSQSNKLTNSSQDLQITAYPCIYHFLKDISPFKGGISISISLLNQTSRGKITLKSNLMRDKPMIETNFFENEQDLLKLTEGVMQIEKVFNSSVLKSFALKSLFPNSKINSKDELKNEIRKNSISGYNLMSSCSMGKVVDEKLNVYGLKGLRISDSSVIPVPISGNIIATTMIIAEKSSDLILDDLINN